MHHFVHRASPGARLFQVAFVAVATAAPALADIPVRYSMFDQPTGTGRGSARLLNNGIEVFANGFNTLRGGGGFNPSTLTGRFMADNDTGGGLGSPVVAVAGIEFVSSVSGGRSNPVLFLSGRGSAFGFTNRTILPGEVASAGGSGDLSFRFEVTAPIISEWSSSNFTLSLNGNVLPIGSTWIGTLEPGMYQVAGIYSAVLRNTGGVVDINESTSASFNLNIGIPSPSAASVLSLAAFSACRRRRHR